MPQQTSKTQQNRTSNPTRRHIGMFKQMLLWCCRLKHLLPLYREQNLTEWRNWGTRRAIDESKSLGIYWENVQPPSEIETPGRSMSEGDRNVDDGDRE